MHAMCNLNSRKYGYICDECFEELVLYLLQGKGSISEFMDSKKPENPFLTEDKIREMLEEEFSPI